MQQKDAVKYKLSSFILESGLFRNNSEKERFSLLTGGVFRCPICGHKLGLFVKQKNYTDHWGIRSFSVCTHFGKNGNFSNDIFGLYAAIHNVNEKQAFHELMDNNAGIVTEAWEKKETEARKQKEDNDRENMQRCALCFESGSLDHKAVTLLEKRGIKLSSLPQSVADKIGYAPKGTKLVSRAGKEYNAEGLVFKCDSSYQIRRTDGDSFVSKNRTGVRFITAGHSSPFNTENIDPHRPLYISEGVIDALSLMMMGISNSIAACGAKNNMEALIDAVSSLADGVPVYVCFDPDDAGQSGSHELITAIRETGHPAWRLSLSPECHDSNDALLYKRNQAVMRLREAELFALSLNA